MNQRGQYGARRPGTSRDLWLGAIAAIAPNLPEPTAEREKPSVAPALVLKSLPVVVLTIGLVGLGVIALMRHGTT